MRTHVCKPVSMNSAVHTRAKQTDFTEPSHDCGGRSRQGERREQPSEEAELVQETERLRGGPWSHCHAEPPGGQNPTSPGNRDNAGLAQESPWKTIPEGGVPAAVAAPVVGWALLVPLPRVAEEGPRWPPLQHLGQAAPAFPVAPGCSQHCSPGALGSQTPSCPHPPRPAPQFSGKPWVSPCPPAPPPSPGLHSCSSPAHLQPRCLPAVPLTCQGPSCP